MPVTVPKHALVTLRRRKHVAVTNACAALMLMGCKCIDVDDPWIATVAYNEDTVLQERQVSEERSELTAPNCKIKNVPKPPGGQAGSAADPNLLEVARLELERDCYKRAEEEARRKLKDAPVY